MNLWERTVFWLAMGMGCGAMIRGVVIGSQFTFASGLLLVAMMGLAYSLRIKLEAWIKARDESQP